MTKYILLLAAVVGLGVSSVYAQTDEPNPSPTATDAVPKHPKKHQHQPQPKKPTNPQSASQV